MDKEEKDAAVYVRVSTNKQDAENQLLQLRPYCEKAGYKIHKEYIDVISGGEERPTKLQPNVQRCSPKAV